MTQKDPTAYKRKALERQRKRDRGLAPMEVWAHPSNFKRIKAYVKRLESTSMEK